MSNPFLYKKGAVAKQQAPHKVGKDIFMLGVDENGFSNALHIIRLLMMSVFTSSTVFVKLWYGLVISTAVDYGS